MPPANGIDSGDNREGSKTPATTPADAFWQGSNATDKNAFQQNVSKTVGTFWGFYYQAYSAGSNIGRWFDSPLGVIFILLNPDSGGGDLVPTWYIPVPGNNVGAMIFKGWQCDIYSSFGNIVMFAEVDIASTFPVNGPPYGGQQYNGGNSIGAQLGENLEIDFVQLIPKGTYTISCFSNNYSTPTGTTVAYYHSTPQGDSLITSFDGFGTSSAGATTSFTVSTLWAWIKIKVTNLQGGDPSSTVATGVQITAYTP